MLERSAIAVGTSPTSQPRAGILVFAADHGVSKRGVSLCSPEQLRAAIEAR
jgi:hypothetical protein